MLVQKFESIERISNGYIIHADTADILLIFMTDDIVRIRVSFNREFEEASYALVTTAWLDKLDNLFKCERKRIKALTVEYIEDEKSLTFKTQTLSIVLFKQPLHFVFYNKQGNMLYSDLRERAFEKDFLGRIFHYNMIDRDYDHFYGFGERTGNLDKRQKRMRNSPKDAIGHDPEHGDPMYKHIPFYIRINEKTKASFGLFYNNSYESTFDMGKERSGYWDPYSYYKTDGGDIDLFFLNGPRVNEVVRRYTYLTGTQALPPKQSLGYTASTMYYTELEKDNDKEIYDVIKTYQNEDINIDNFWLASGYSSGENDNLRYTFNWNYKRFPNPDAFFDKMNDLGINVIPNLKPGVLKNHPYRDQYASVNGFVKTPDQKKDYVGRWWGGAGLFPDFTNPDTREVWKKLLKKTILQKGTGTVWNDNCEYDGIEDRDAYCSREGLGGRIAELKPIQANMMAYVAKQAIEEVYPNRRPYIINRAGYTGIQRYAQTWAGDNLTDWRTLKYDIETILGMGISGVANQGCDIGGFDGCAPEGELLLRWIQNGIFQPRFVINSANNDNTVTQPFMYKEYNDYVREAYHLRYKMLPYLYSLMFNAYKTGEPIMRPTFYEFQNDQNCYDDKYFTFMYGPSVLVANVLEKGVTSRKLYLPEGTVWYDMNDNLKPYKGGQIIEIPVTLESIPMFIQDKGIFVTSPDIKHISTDILKHLEILIGNATNTSFLFYDDDGYTNNFKKGQFSLTKITVKGDKQKIIQFDRNGSYQSTIEFVTLKLISKDKGALWVSVDGIKIKSFLILEQWEKSTEGWYYNLSDRTILIKIRLPQKDKFDIVVSTEKFDLIGMLGE
ncbi:TIM-barrel domain-containing protein [Enterococcus sp. DIV0086]|uniref:glycoside hydrolase family 31 protein n=1 Tax=Enterococcus sp. DIV0086 TaxID=2774655 RepID=UPI003D2927E9